MAQEKLEDLRKKVEQRDRRWRIFEGLFVVLLFLAAATSLIVNIQTLAGVNDQLKQQQKTVQQIKNNTDTQLDTLNKHIDCLLFYFNQTDRTNITIEDVNRCTLQNHDTAQQFFATPSDQVLDDDNSSTPSSAIITPSTTSASTSSTSNASSNPSTPTMNPQPTSSPLTILGIPACVPALGVCVNGS